MRIDFIGYDNKPYIIGDKKLVRENRVLEHADEEGAYFVMNTNIDGVYTYGFQQAKADYMGNPAGYIWSSRAGVINKIFDVALVEACYKEEGSPSYTSCSIDLAHLEPLLADTDYEIVWEPVVDETDVRYRIIKRS